MNEPANPRESQKGALPTESHAVDILVAALATILAFALCLAALTQRSIWADELSTLAMFPTRDLRSLVQQIADAFETSPPVSLNTAGVKGRVHLALRVVLTMLVEV